jgi:hypothetical protein
MRTEVSSRCITPITVVMPRVFSRESKHFSGSGKRIEYRARSERIVVEAFSTGLRADGRIRVALDASPDSRHQEYTMQMTTVGLFAGLILGLALVLGNFGDMLIVALFGAIGVVVCKVIEGDLDLSQLTNRQRRS